MPPQIARYGRLSKPIASARPVSRACRGRGPRLAVRPRRRRSDEQRERDLHIVMIDPARRELLIGRHADEREQQRHHRGFAAGDAPGDRGHAGDGRQQPHQRPPGAHQPLRRLRLEGLEQQVEAREPGIDQPRPVRVVAGRRLNPRIVQVEPALPGEPGAHLDQPHGVVGVEQGLRRLPPVLQQQSERDDEPHQRHQDAEIRLA